MSSDGMVTSENIDSDYKPEFHGPAFEGRVTPEVEQVVRDYQHVRSGLTSLGKDDLVLDILKLAYERREHNRAWKAWESNNEGVDQYGSSQGH